MLYYMFSDTGKTNGQSCSLSLCPCLPVFVISLVVSLDASLRKVWNDHGKVEVLFDRNLVVVVLFFRMMGAAAANMVHHN